MPFSLSGDSPWAPEADTVGHRALLELFVAIAYT